MADSFADLWTSSAPKPSSQTLGAAVQSQSQSQSRAGTPSLTSKPRANDLFSMLAASNPRTSAPSSRPITPSTSQPKPMPSAGGGDAFSALLSGSFTSGSSAKMTIAEVEAQRNKSSSGLLGASDSTGSSASASGAWTGLDSLASRGHTPSPAFSAKPSIGDDWGLGEFGGETITAPLTTKDLVGQTHFDSFKSASTSKASVALDAGEDEWGIFTEPARSVQPRTQSERSGQNPAPAPADDGWGIFDSPNARPSALPSRDSGAPRNLDTGSRSIQGLANPADDFDFGDRDREYDTDHQPGLLDPQSGDEEEPLGSLSKAVQNSRVSRTNSSSYQPPPPRRSGSPPPHLVGQIVEMGFSPADARRALDAATTVDGNWNVQMAIDNILAERGTGSDPSRAPPPRRRDHDRESDSSVDGRRRRRQRSAPDAANRDITSPPSNATPNTTAELLSNVNIQEQADRLLSTASELSKGVFSRANALWASGKKLYEETAIGAISTGKERDVVRDGRPRWMIDADIRPDNDDDDHIEKPHHKVSTKERREVPPESQGQNARAELAIDLFVDEPAPTVYVSRFRRGGASGSLSPAPQLSSLPAVPLPQQGQVKPTVRASPTKAARPPISISAAAKFTSTTHASSAASLASLGQFAAAVDKYSLALNALPISHVDRIAILNARASARLKTGDHVGASEDCSEILGVIGDWDDSSQYRDSQVQAWRSRAEASEGREKWRDALKDWDALAGAVWAERKLKDEAARGSIRCRKIIDPPKSKPSNSIPKAKPASRPVAVQQNSEALNKLRATTSALEVEDSERHNLKDAVDARLLAWKGGKETNLRGLLSSLDMVLWPSLGWKTIGLGDLISPVQVKKAYVRAIAKVHPDKLNAGNTGLEDRMIANGVFGTLNEAWNAFKP